MKLYKPYAWIIMLSLYFIKFGVTAQECASNYDNPWQWASHATWFTGNGVFINFPGGTGSPVVTTKTFNLGDNTNSAYEGTAAFSDNNGNIIGWCNGRKLWRDDGADGVLVADDLVAGNEDGSVGQRSSAVQGIVAVRHPNIPEKIFIFTSDDVLSSDIGPHYVVYDINTQSSTAPVRLQNDLGINYRSTEQIDATFHANGNDIWVVIRQSGRGNYNNFRSFYSYLITCDGLNPVPVKSNDVVPETGHTFTGGGGFFQSQTWWNDYGRGALKISWDGTKAATGNHITGGADSDESLMIFDFDNATGLLSNAVSFARVTGIWNWDNAFTNWGASYDLEWAPNNRGLYVSSIRGAGELLWFDTEAGDAAEINASGRLISGTFRQFTDIKIGGDGNLYAPGSGSSLNVYSFTSEDDLNNGVGMSYSTLNTTNLVSLGLSNVFIPPIDFINLSTNPDNVNCTDSPIDLSVFWLCQGGNAEDNTVNGWSSDCGGCITDAANGIFDPSIAGEGQHKVFYTRGNTCSQLDSLTITVSCNSCPDTTLSNTIDTVCIDETVDLTIYEVTSDAGKWSIVNTPLGSSPATILPGDSIFDATNADPGTYRIRFTLDSTVVGCPDSSERDIIVNAKPAISLTGGSFCAGDSLLLDAGNPGAIYQWSNGRTNQTEYFSTEGPHKVIVTISGCIDSAQVTLTVNDVPSVSITAPDVKCTNDSIKDLAASPLGGQWYLNGDTLSSAILNPESIGDTSFVLVYEYTDGNGCSGIDTLLDTLYQSPEITEMPDLGTVCSSQSPFKLMALPSEPEGKWYINGDSLIGDTLYPDSLSAGVFDVVYVYTNIDGCSDSDTSSLIINDVLDVKIDSILSNCDNQGIDTLEASPQGGQWYINNDSIYSAVFNTDSLGEGSHLVKYVYSNGSGCSDSDSVTVTINKAPTVDIGPDTFFCAGSSIELDAGSGFSDYKWTPIGSGSTNIVDSSGDISVVVIDNNGCSDTSQVTITQKELPEVDLGDTIYVCEDDSLTLYAVEPDSSSYSWLPNNEKTDTLRIGSDNELYIVTITDTTNGCQFIDSVQILEDVPPKIDLGGDDKICDDSLKTLEAGFFSGVSYEWYLDYELIPDQTAQKLEADSGIYRVKLITENGCKSSDTVYIDNHQLPIIVLDDEYEFCELDSLEIDLGSGPIGLSYLWSTGDSTQSIWVKSEEIISVEVTDTNTCTNSGTITVKENLLPLINLAGSDSACEGREILLDVEIPNGILYEWSNGHDDSEYTLVGPDTLQVKITTDKNCVDSATIEVKDLPPLDLSDIGDTNKVCFQSEEDNPINAGYFEDAEYLWALPDGTTETGNSIVPLLDGWYTVNVTDRFSCKGQDSIFNIVLPIPNINLGPDKSFCSLGHEVDTVRMNFSQNTSGTITWEAWDDKGNIMENNISDNDTLFITEIAPIFISGLFVDNSGCSNTDTVHLNEKCEPIVLTFPNVIVPNGNTNTTFRPIELTDEVLDKLLNNILWSKFEVYNRWGYRLFQSENILPRWDGVFENRPVSAGTYYWIFKYEDSSVKMHSLNGFVEVLEQ